MNYFSWAKALGYAVLIWAIMLLIASAIAYAVGIGNTWAFILAFAAGAVSYIFAISASPENSSQAFGYGLAWVILGVFLDLVITSRFQSNLFSMWTYWLGYVLVFFGPWVEYQIEGTGHHPKAI